VESSGLEGDNCAESHQVRKKRVERLRREDNASKLITHYLL